MEEKFYHKKWFIWLMILFLWPVGILLLWLTPSYSKKIKLIISGAFLALFVALAMMAENTDRPVPEQPAKTVAAEKTIEEKWTTVDKEFKAEMAVKDYYPFVVEVSAQRDESKKEITLAAIIQPSTKPAIALDFADTMLRRYAALAKIYLGKDYKPGTKDYYGGLFDDYNATIMIAPPGAADPDDCFVYDRIMSTMHTKQPIELTKKYK